MEATDLMGAIDRVFDAWAVPFDAWVETGTLHGEGADWLRRCVAPVGVTIDCHDWGYRADGVQTLFGDSATLMPEALQGLTGRVALWLDAHYPHTYLAGLPVTVLPLQAELDAILAWHRQPGNEAWVWADDMRIYGDPCQSGVLPPEYAGGATLDLSAWADTHLIHRWPADEGYLMLRPRKV